MRPPKPVLKRLKLAYRIDRRHTYPILLVDAETGRPIDGLVGLSIRERVGDPVRVRATITGVKPYEAK